LRNETVYDNIKSIIHKTLKTEETQSVNLALALSRNTLLKNALIQNNPNSAQVTLNDSIEYLQEYSQQHIINAQIFNAQQQLFAQSFILPSQGEPLMQKNEVFSEQTTVNFYYEQGLRMQVMVPMFENKRGIGFLQVTSTFESVVEKLRLHQLELLPLLNHSYVEKSEDKPLAFNDFVVASQNYNQKVVHYIQSFDNESKRKLIQQDYLHTPKGLFLLYPFNVNGAIIGKQIVYMPTRAIKQFHSNDYSVLQSIFNLNSTQKDMYNFVKYENDNMFLSIKKDYIGHLKGVVEPSDLQEFEEVAREKLQQLSKEELIDLMLNTSSQSKIEGKIR
jgi:hypothetical protein